MILGYEFHILGIKTTLGQHIAKNLPVYKLSAVHLSWGDIFIIIKASTQQGANWLIGWAFAQS